MREAIAAMGITVEPLPGPMEEQAAGVRAEHTRLRLPDATVSGARQMDGELLTYDDRLAGGSDLS